jgi:ubiquinone/menaquinone biosynthesis C-methylase UbiE
MGLAGMDKYSQSCKTEFWRSVFRAETDYIVRELNGAKDVLSVGCGPAIIETDLAEHGFNVTGLDISEEALQCAPDSMRTTVGSAETMNFPAACFDAVIFVASLQFIEKYRQAVKQTARVLKPGGKLLVMLLNPESAFFKEKMNTPDSYVRKIKHTDLREIEREIAKFFTVRTEYFLGIEGERIFESSRPDSAGLYVINGRKN